MVQDLKFKNGPVTTGCWKEPAKGSTPHPPLPSPEMHGPISHLDQILCVPKNCDRAAQRL